MIGMRQGYARIYSASEGEELVKAARYVVESYVSSAKFSRWIAEERLEGFKMRHGLFVAFEHYPTRTLRGCIGFTKPQDPVKKALVDAAIAASTEDPTARPISHMELDHLVAEVSVLLHEPVQIKGSTPLAIKRQVKAGKEGLMLRYGIYTGVLLPQTVMDNGWNAEQALDGVCTKAGLPTHTWKKHNVSLYRFASQVFRESSPRGAVEEIIFQ